MKNVNAGKLTIVDWYQESDVDAIEISSFEEMDEMINGWLEKKSHERTVFVCFHEWEGDEVELPGKYPRIMITDVHQEVEDEYLHRYEICDDVESINFNIFEFKTWEQALEFCIDLKEGL